MKKLTWSRILSVTLSIVGWTFIALAILIFLCATMYGFARVFFSLSGN